MVSTSVLLTERLVGMSPETARFVLRSAEGSVSASAGGILF